MRVQTVCIRFTGAVLALAGVGISHATDPQRPFPQHAAYTAGTIKPNHRIQSVLDQDVRDAYAAWKQRYLAQTVLTEPDGHARYRVLFGPTNTASDATVSEGQGYGMLIVALMAGADPAAQTIFDGLWEYFNDHRSVIDNRLMAFYVRADETSQAGEDDSAYDGDADIALALLIAQAQWGNAGRIDYRARALDVLAGQAASVMGPASKLPLLGDWVEPAGAQYNQYTVRSSDFMPGHAQVFFAATGNTLWRDSQTAMADAIDDIQLLHSPSTGLLPDFLRRNTAMPPRFEPVAAGFLEGAHDGHYDYNAGRDPWRLATHVLLHGDARTRVQVQRMTDWIATSTGGNAMLIRPGYLLNGTPIATNYFTSFFAAPFGVAAMLDPPRQSWLNAVYDSVRTRQEGYYEDSVTLLCLLVMTGNFWDPALGEVPIFASGFESASP